MEKLLLQHNRFTVVPRVLESFAHLKILNLANNNVEPQEEKERKKARKKERKKGATKTKVAFLCVLSAKRNHEVLFGPIPSCVILFIY